MKVLYKKWKIVVNRANAVGVPLPTVRDPKSGLGSVSLTLVFISSSLVILGIVGKWSKSLGEIDIRNALEFFYASSALYFGRQWHKKTDTKPEESSEAPVDSPEK